MIEGIGDGSPSVTGDCLPVGPSRCIGSTILMGARLGRLDRRPSLDGFRLGFLDAAVDSLRFTEGVEADRGPLLGRTVAAPGVVRMLASAGAASDVSR